MADEVKKDQGVAKKEPTMAERFTAKVMEEFTAGAGGELALTDFQKRLAQNYFMAVDMALAKAEKKRLKKKNNQDKTPVTWANVNLEQLSRDVVSAARIGLDPAQDNHVNMVPYKNNALGKYDIGFIDGYRGLELKAKKYGLDIPDHVVVELVYSTDRFTPHKKDMNHEHETYEFEIVNTFSRGEIVGGFYYHIYSQAPEKNKLVVMTLADIIKRKPKYASAEFWGGEKDVWKNGQKTGEKEKVEGWYEKMCHKTVYRAAFRDITIDSQKIDDDYLRLRQLETELADAEVEEEIEDNANGDIIDLPVEADELLGEEEAEVEEPAEPKAADGPGY
ncbi:MAG: recombinase RecT [Thermoleophilia bacterium]